MKPQIEPPPFQIGPHESISEPPTEIINLKEPTPITWQEMVHRLAKKPSEIIEQMTPEKASALAIATHGALTVTISIDAAKKFCIYNKAAASNPWKDIFRPTAESFMEMTEHQAALLHAAIGMFGEAGEILENVLRHINGETLDLDNSVEESGDLGFYHEDYRRTLGFTQEQARQANMNKLGKRYPGFIYSDASAAARSDKANE
jgi:hypothetical protein